MWIGWVYPVVERKRAGCGSSFGVSSSGELVPVAAGLGNAPRQRLALSRRWLACCAVAPSVRDVRVSCGALLFKAF